MRAGDSVTRVTLEEADHGVLLGEVTVPVTSPGVGRRRALVTPHPLRPGDPPPVSADCGHVLSLKLVSVPAPPHSSPYLGPLTLQRTDISGPVILTELLLFALLALPGPVAYHFLLQIWTRVWAEIQGVRL